ncbi:ribonuclease Y [Spiroplasma endosymbiont of Amphibalanus improvisus]|uniref:ribonuclease Y n=1 Tax=Spiroplasma endosymbiont of Amphibalanus improvisus TaxID=3066327 RepID=UPI00313E4CC3
MNNYIWITILLLAIMVSFAIGFLSYFYFKKSQINKFNNKIEESKQKAQAIVNTAIADAKLFTSKEMTDFETKLSLKYLEWEKTDKYYETKLKNLNEREKDMDHKDKELIFKKNELKQEIEKYSLKRDEVIMHLEKIATFSKAEAKSFLINEIKNKTQLELNKYLKEYEVKLRSESKKMSTNILVQSMERYTPEIILENTISIIKLPNDDLKSRIIGREGRNIKSFQKITGVDLIVDEDKEVVKISCFNPIRREIAKLTLEKLIENGNIQPISIEETAKVIQEDIDNVILETGKDIANSLGITDFNIEIIENLGKLKYRTSFGQNVLMHSVEVAKLTGTIAAELGLSSEIGKRAGLLHDIGKAVDSEEIGSHVTLGIEIAKRNNESDIIINAIHSHHGEVKPNNVYSRLVVIADTLSASKPGSRNNSIEKFFTRMKELEDTCLKFSGVKKAYVFKSGHQIQVIVDPKMVSENKLLLLSGKLEEEIKKTKNIPGDINITIIRETIVKAKVI